MTFDEYQKKAITTDVFKNGTPIVTDPAFFSKILGLAGESGEVADKFKKILRDKNGILSEDDVKEIIKELGDVLWYINIISSYMGATLEQVAKSNLDKVLGRKERDLIKGSGDNR